MNCAQCGEPTLAPVLGHYCGEECARDDGWVKVGDGWERP